MEASTSHAAPARNSSSERRHSFSEKTEFGLNSKRRKLDSEEAEPHKSLLPKFERNLTACSKKKKKKVKKGRKRGRNEGEVYGGRTWTVSPLDSSKFKDRIVIVSYNILGVENASKHPHLYFRVPHKFLDWDQRKMKICKEISSYHPGILCFQEVDRFEELDALLQEDGFKGVYQGRTGEALDGCSIFWKHNLFTLLHQESIEFRSFDLRDNVAQFCVLKMNQSQSDSLLPAKVPKATQKRSLVVGNIHVLFNPQRGDIKLGQVRMFTEKANQISQAWGNIPIILAGDFNSLPKSAMYQYLSSSELDTRLHDRRNISGPANSFIQSRSFQSVHFKSNGFWSSIPKPLMFNWSKEELSSATGHEEITRLGHRLNLSSAYLGIPGSFKTRDKSGEPLTTSYHSEFMGTVDYIWHTEDLVPLKLLETLPLTNLRETGGLPSKDWGSDHLALVCEFAFLEKANTGPIE